MILATWRNVTVLRGYHEAPMHELTGTGKTGCGRRSLAQPQHEVALTGWLLRVDERVVDHGEDLRKIASAAGPRTRSSMFNLRL